jgi:hypothetical protein
VSSDVAALSARVRWVVAGYRLALAVLTLTALGVQLNTSRKHPIFRPVNFFSYMTTLSNVVGALVIAVLAFATLTGRGGAVLDYVRGAATLYLTVTFGVWALLLSDLPLGILQPWVNVVLHIAMPWGVLLDWLVLPPARELDWRRAMSWLLFPLCYAAYSLIRGAITGWYPYPFLDPTLDSGYAGVIGASVGIAAAYGVLTLALLWLARHPRRPWQHTDTRPAAG